MTRGFKTKGGKHNSASANASTSQLVFKRNDSQLRNIDTKY